ncbi:DUF2895 family protein [Legionella yabuuchiae]|uniref:DUF2895 family protein n=1 Tax=Legionella yabuuchiae TaxID=376727 RepID=UPI00105494C9|nr:DUF2895 family protein [Legionella yabuuchiae]
MFNYWKKIDSLHHHNRLLLAFVALLSIIVLALIITLYSLPKRYEFWLSPGMAANGGLIKARDIPNEYVQGFVTSLMPTLYSWQANGRDEFNRNMKAFHYYFTPRHEQLLEQTFSVYKNAQLFNRTQITSLYRFMEPDDIKRIGPNSWEVKLVLRITQRLKDNSPMVIADKVVAYHLRVVKLNLSRLHNPFQLALDGYSKPETLVKDLLVQPEDEYANN